MGWGDDDGDDDGGREDAIEEKDDDDDGCCCWSAFSWYWRSLTEPSAKAAANIGALGCQQRSNIPGRSKELCWWRSKEEEEEVSEGD